MSDRSCVRREVKRLTASPKANGGTVLRDLDAPAVLFELMTPAVAGWRRAGEHWLGWRNEGEGGRLGHQVESWHDPRAELPGVAMGLARNIRLGLHRIGLTLAALPMLIGLVGLVSQEETIYRSNAQLSSAKQDAATLRRDDWTICERDVLTAAKEVLTLRDFAATYDDKNDGCHVTKSSDGYPLKYLKAIETLVIQRRTSAYELARSERGRYHQFGFGLAVLSLVIYGLCCLLGWILSGFAGE